MALIDLSKKVGIILEKKKIANIVAQVGFAIDVSGSMQELYRNGTMQELVNRIQGIADRFDDNHSLDVWIFDHRATELKPATLEMFGRYVQDEILSRSNIWGSTRFADVLGLVRDHYFGANVVEKAKGFISSLFSKKEVVQPTKSADPVFLIFLTDGVNDDEINTIEMIESMKAENIYIQFIGVGSSRFDFISTLGGRYPNVGMMNIKDLHSMTDEQLYDALLNDEFVEWVKIHAAK